MLDRIWQTQIICLALPPLQCIYNVTYGHGAGSEENETNLQRIVQIHPDRITLFCKI
jgi:hypothetical protein